MTTKDQLFNSKNTLSRSFDFVSANSLFLCGYTPEEFKEMGYDFYLKHIPKEDQELLLETNKAGFDFYEKMPLEERLLYSITYDFRLIRQNGKVFFLNHKYTPLMLSDEGKIRKAVCVFSLATNEAPGNINFKYSTAIKYILQIPSCLVV